MGGIFSSPSPPPPPPVSEEETRRSQQLDAEEKRESKPIASRRKSRRGRSARLLMSVVRAAPEVTGQAQQLASKLGGSRNPRG